MEVVLELALPSRSLPSYPQPSGSVGTPLNRSSFKEVVLRTLFRSTKSNENPPKSGPGAPPGRPGDAPGCPGPVLEVLDLSWRSWRANYKDSTKVETSSGSFQDSRGATDTIS